MPDSFIHLLVIRCHGSTYLANGHAAAIQISVPQEDFILEIEEAERRRGRPKRFWVRAWLTNERRLQFGHHGQLKLPPKILTELNWRTLTRFFNYIRLELQVFDHFFHRVSVAQIGHLE